MRRCKHCGARTRRTGYRYTWRGLGGTAIGIVLARGCPKCLRTSTERRRTVPR